MPKMNSNSQHVQADDIKACLAETDTIPPSTPGRILLAGKSLAALPCAFTGALDHKVTWPYLQTSWPLGRTCLLGCPLPQRL